MSGIVGWDVGGAHLKAARVENGRVVATTQVPCQLWLGVDRLVEALDIARRTVGEAERHTATTTGELTDLFALRSEGVTRIAAILRDRLAPAEVTLYAGPDGFIDAERAGGHTNRIASANWHASASLVAGQFRDALFVDMGSTTTDLVPITGGEVAARGYTDSERLAEGELAYSGLTRTFLMAVCERAPFRGRWLPLMNEYFASMADVHRILGHLDEASDQHPAADGREKTVAASRQRLARMIGADAGSATDGEWSALAGWFAEAQLRKLEDAARQVLSRCMLPSDAPLIGAGTGLAVVGRLAGRLNRPLKPFAALLHVAPEALPWIEGCVPATAVAILRERTIIRC